MFFQAIHADLKTGSGCSDIFKGLAYLDIGIPVAFKLHHVTANVLF